MVNETLHSVDVKVKEIRDWIGKGGIRPLELIRCLVRSSENYAEAKVIMNRLGADLEKDGDKGLRLVFQGRYSPWIPREMVSAMRRDDEEMERQERLRIMHLGTKEEVGFFGYHNDNGPSL